MGRPVLGEHTKLEVIIEESYEFKVLSTSLVPVLPFPPFGFAQASTCLWNHSKARQLLASQGLRAGPRDALKDGQVKA